MGSGAGSIKHYGADEYFALGECGALSPDDRVELLDGLIVTMPPQAPYHTAVVHHLQDLLLQRLPPNTVVRTQSPFIAGATSVPEPDVLVFPGTKADYVRRHPTKAFLVIEVADTSLAQDRMTKARIYAAASVPSYWLVNLRERVVECFRSPDAAGASYLSIERVSGEGLVVADSLPDLILRAEELFPPETR